MEGERQIFDAYASRLRLFVAARANGREDVDDLVQETFLRFYALPQADDVRHPLGYLYRIALNIIIDRSRRRSPLSASVDIDDVSEDYLATRPQQEDRRGLADLQRAYAAALAELSPRCAEVFNLRRHREMTTPDVAAHLGITTRMVQKHMVVAMAHLHQRMRAYVSCELPDEGAGSSVPARCQIASSSSAQDRVIGSSSRAA